VFVHRAALDAFLADVALLGGVASYRTGARPSTSPELAQGRGAYEPSFSYLNCPVCGRTMNRQNFLKRSGVIVDQCLHHGTWFDSDEAQRAAEFVAAGGKAPPDELTGDGGDVSFSRGEALLALLRR
jgi:hypothetical protein